MKTTANLWRTTLAGAALAALWGGLALGGDDNRTAKAPVPGPKGAAGNGSTPGLRAFELTHADPEEVRQILNQLSGNLAARLGVRPIPGTPTGLRVAVDPRTHTLFVRATDKELEAVADIVAVLDADPAKPSASEGKNAAIIRLRYAKVPEVVQVLTGLGLQGQVLALPKTGTLLLTGTDQEGKEIRAVIEKLDVERKTEAKPPVKKPAPVND